MSTLQQHFKSNNHHFEMLVGVPVFALRYSFLVLLMLILFPEDLELPLSKKINRAIIVIITTQHNTIINIHIPCPIHWSPF